MQVVIVLVISNGPSALPLADFEITFPITPWIVLHSGQLLLLIIKVYLTMKTSDKTLLDNIVRFKKVKNDKKL